MESWHLIHSSATLSEIFLLCSITKFQSEKKSISFSTVFTFCEAIPAWFFFLLLHSARNEIIIEPAYVFYPTHVIHNQKWLIVYRNWIHFGTPFAFISSCDTIGPLQWATRNYFHHGVIFSIQVVLGVAGVQYWRISSLHGVGAPYTPTAQSIR